MLIPPYYAASGGEYTQKRFNLLEIYNIRRSTSKRARRFEAFNRSVVNPRED
ncbi:hypothetical protein [Rickettsia endosymbiont of Gonocerus acuteangulatus]|uniref:hypothetical protein n=1 Tax=Rickettsia endosymbiont of Gonocerus acuteangulatus TaxID=3066266 RepID=UPI003132FF56